MNQKTLFSTAKKIRRNPSAKDLTPAERNALIQYYRVGIDGLVRVKGKTIKSLMNKDLLTGHGFTQSGKWLAKKLSDEEHEKSLGWKSNPSRRWYVGVNRAGYHTFSCASKPTQQSHGAIYNAVIGPFRTKRGAEYMAKYGKGNPHLQTVDDAERFAAGAY